MESCALSPWQYTRAGTKRKQVRGRKSDLFSIRTGSKATPDYRRLPSFVLRQTFLLQLRSQLSKLTSGNTNAAIVFNVVPLTVEIHSA
jgi:hypothetical protein